jgi:hypothetical protein
MKTEKIHFALTLISWVVFIGLLIQTGAIIISFSVSITNAEAAKDLFLGLDLYDLRLFSFRHYVIAVFLMINIVLLKAYAAYLSIKLLTKIKLSNPFKDKIASLIEKISYVVLVIGGTVIVASAQNDWLAKNGVHTPFHLDPGGILLLAGILFIVAHIFKRGVLIQSENELTI